MKRFKNYLKADWYKFVKSNIILSHLLIPILGLVLMLAFFTLSPLNEIEKASAYIQVISMAFPLAISIVITMVYEQEECSAKFQYFLSTSTKRYLPHVSKLFLLFFLGILATLISIIGFAVLSYIFYGGDFNFIFINILIITIFVSDIPIYMIQYLVVYYLGKGASICLGIIGSLVVALMITGLGDGIWFLIPWGCSGRLPLYLCQNVLTNNFNLMLYSEVKVAIISIIVYVIISIIILKKFSDNWEGNKEY